MISDTPGSKKQSLKLKIKEAELAFINHEEKKSVKSETHSEYDYMHFTKGQNN